MKKVIWFFDLFARALNPFSYKHLSEIVLRIPIKFFFILLLISTLLYSILSIPTFLSLSDELSSELGQFTRFDVNINATADKPLVFPKKSPLIVVDLNNESDNDAMITITEDMMIKKKMFGEEIIYWDDYRDMTDNMDSVSSSIIKILILISPLIFIIIYLKYALMYGLIVIFTAIIGIIILSFTRFKINLEQLLKISIFASTPIIFVIISDSFSILHFNDIARHITFFIVYLIYVSIGVVKTGSFNLHKRTKKFK